jgi:predicted  nucleic acid-binding Zn-ribbon protein
MGNSGGWSRDRAGRAKRAKIVVALLSEMLPEIQNLIELQRADREILRLKDEIAALPKRMTAIEERLAGTRAGLDKAKAAVKADEASRRKYETAISDAQQKISKYRDQSLEVKTNEQYKALMHEIQFAEQDIQANEDKILELMVNAEAREKEVKAAEAELKAEMAEIEKEKVQARERTAEDEKQMAEWNTKRERARGGVDADVLRQYDRVAKYRGTGISEVRDQKCMACQVMLRPQTYNEVRSDKRVSCESCQRLLYYDPSHDHPAIETRKRRAHPKIDASQGWYYRAMHGEEGEVFLVFVNQGVESSRRIYDAASGRKIGETLLREGAYRLGFPEELTADTIRLNGHWPEAEIDEWGVELPTATLDALHRDLNLARVEAAAPSKHAKEVVTAEHPVSR